MRYISLVFGVICGAIIIAIAARFGFKTSDSDWDGYVWAFTFGAVTFGGLSVHAAGVRLWSVDKKFVALIAFAIGIAALTVSLTNSLGAMAGRMNVTQAARIQTNEAVRDARRSLQDKEAERRAMVFKPADDIAVSAARIAQEAATKAKAAECKIQGTLCRKKQDIEQAALLALRDASQNRAATELAAKLDREIEGLKEKIEKAGPVLEANSQGNALAQLFALPESWAAFLSTWQAFAMAIILEVMTAGAFIIFEVLAPAKAHACPASTLPSDYLEIMRADEPKTKRLTSLPVAAQQLDAAIEAQETPASVDDLTLQQPKQRTKAARVPRSPVSRSKPAGKPRKSRVAASVDDGREYGDVDAWYDEAVQSGAIIERASAEAGAGPCRDAFSSWCEARNLKPLSPKDFGTAMKEKLGSDRIEVRRKYTYYQGFMLRPVLALVRE